MAEKENVSALFDGEDNDKRLVAALGSDKSAQESWKSYSVIRDTLRGDAPASLDWDIASRVSAALEDEPSHSKASQEMPPVQSTPVIQPHKESQPRPGSFTLPGWLQPLGQVGMAAAVCMAIIVGVQSQNPTTDLYSSEVGSQPPVLETVPFSGAAEPVSINSETERSNTTLSEEQLREQRRRINALLQDFELQLRLNAKSADTEQDLQK
ncbi:RseA family anti-sigma factor [Veronia pacifica]|uniref:Anti-sigma-E factor RseA n=1 Tax=Veronia pacifica TaxID=1080227 RepID=A0A1C3EJ09_9GAMM|nr:RseA family anti-sigma factor [Veronia pacifica]ODA33213.1 hypothetical protein A8L45_11385 [Veronia pacifica]